MKNLLVDFVLNLSKLHVCGRFIGWIVALAPLACSGLVASWIRQVKYLLGVAPDCMYIVTHRLQDCVAASTFPHASNSPCRTGCCSRCRTRICTASSWSACSRLSSERTGSYTQDTLQGDRSTHISSRCLDAGRCNETAAKSFLLV